MKFNIVDKDFFKYSGSSRLDAEYADPDLYAIEEVFESKLDGVTISTVCSDYKGPTINASYKSDDISIKYIAIDSIDNIDGLVIPQEMKFIDRPSRSKYEVESGDILVSNVRPNRNAVTLIQARNCKNIASSGFTLLKQEESQEFEPEYVFAFFKTKHGVNQLIRRNRGSMYPAVLGQDVFSCIIPKVSEEISSQIIELVKKGHLYREEFFKHLEFAESMLYKYFMPLGSPPSPLESNKKSIDFSIVNHEDFFKEGGALRFDAEFFRDEYTNFDSKLNTLEKTFLLGKYYELAPGTGMGKPKEHMKFFKQGCLSNLGIVWSAVESIYGSIGNNCSDVKEGDILLACTAHEVYYVGRKVDLVRNLPNDFTKNTAVSDLLVIRERDSKPEWLPNSYVATFLRSDIGRHQVQRCIRGLRGGHVYARDLSRFVRIPIPSKDLLNKYEIAIEKAENMRNKSKKTLLKAFSIFEKEIDDKINVL